MGNSYRYQNGFRRFVNLFCIENFFLENRVAQAVLFLSILLLSAVCSICNEMDAKCGINNVQ
jgi:hypothetical protein